MISCVVGPREYDNGGDLRARVGVRLGEGKGRLGNAGLRSPSSGLVLYRGAVMDYDSAYGVMAGDIMVRE